MPVMLMRIISDDNQQKNLKFENFHSLTFELEFYGSHGDVTWGFMLMIICVIYAKMKLISLFYSNFI
jgi:hypothetical protein